MSEESIIVERATDLIKCCKLPRLTRSIDEAPLESTTFDHFLNILNDTLPKVFDLIAQHENQLLANDEFNKENVEFRLNLVLVIGEQLCAGYEECYCFQSMNTPVQKQLRRIYECGQLERILIGDGSERLLKRIWVHYQKVLRATEWMFHPGDIVSFVRICEFLYGGILMEAPALSQSVASFVLSVGIALVEHHDPEYEKHGLSLFNILLNGQHRALMKETNIHLVVFQNAFRLIPKSKNEHLLRELWRCHFQYVELTEPDRTDFAEWSMFDDIIEALLDALAFEQNMNLSSTLLLYLLKMLAIDLPNFTIDDLDDVQAGDTKCHLYEPVLEQLRKYCTLEFRNQRFYRWHKRMLTMLPFELEKACGSSREHGKYMHGVNLLFVLTVFPIEQEAVNSSPSVQTILLDFIIAFKRHMRDQYARIQSLTGKCDFLHSLKASVSCDKSLAIFGKSVAKLYFKDNPNFWSAIGTDSEDSYQEDRIFYECIKELQARNSFL